MANNFGVTLVLFSIWIIKFTVPGSFDVNDLKTDACRITGVTLISYVSKMNFTEAETACEQLGLTLAHTTDVEKALRHGFETCRYGWVADKVLVIPRIKANLKCGQNKTGVVQWKTDLGKKQDGYCFNSSDTWIDSCKPETSISTIPVTATEINSSSTASIDDISEMPNTTTELPTKTKPPKSIRRMCITETILQTEQTSVETQTDMTPPDGKRGAFRNDRVIFGGVPTALLVLALFFFLASVVLAVCYIKKYKKTFPFSKKTQKKEMIETNVIKDAKPSDREPEKEPKNNGKKAEEPQTKSETTVKCVEAEV